MLWGLGFGGLGFRSLGFRVWGLWRIKWTEHGTSYGSCYLGFRALVGGLGVGLGVLYLRFRINRGSFQNAYLASTEI